MKPPPFDYRRPATVEEALGILASEGPDAKVLAGGQSLVPAMNFRLAAPAVLVDLNRLDELDFVADRDDAVAIGAMTRQRVAERSDAVARRAPLVAEALTHVAHPQIRNRGTIGGSLAHADPSAELPAVALAVSARMRAASAENPEGRWIEADDFFPGMFSTALEPGEALVEVEIPNAAPRTGDAFVEFARRHGDYALVGVAVRVTLAEDGRVAEARIALLSVSDGPVRSVAAEEALIGEAPEERAIAEAAATVSMEIDPPSDIHASAAYRRHLAEVLSRRGLGRAVARARSADR
ncbi:MAG: xanthine dehydrogenase family protein subunit M [Gemmatimonadota bacterium]|nr:xanthine dehydrogenase family protein subunit M [Gemmatimonadota bacterium]